MKPAKTLFQSLFLLLAMLLVLSPAYALAGSGDTQTFHYVALGDSLAAGFVHESGIGDGYPTYIKEGLQEQGYDVTLTNKGVGGYTTEDVLNQLENEQIRQVLRDADLITLDIGANDVLREVGTSFDPTDPDVINKAIKAIFTVDENLDRILDEIRHLNPEAPVFVMGYYNALPYLDGQQSIEVMMDSLNSKIKGQADAHGAAFVPTFDAFVGHYEKYLPTPNDIHPTAAGYRVIANRFLDQIIPALPAPPQEEDPGEDEEQPPQDEGQNGDEQQPSPEPEEGNGPQTGDPDQNGNNGDGVNQDENNGEDSGNDIDNSNMGTSKNENGDSSDDVQGGLLPATASNTPLLLLLGTLMAISGGVLTFRRKRSLKETFLDD